MAYPVPFDRSFDFQAYQNANPTRPLPGNQVNAELNAVAASQAEFGVFLAGITRADGKLANGIVNADSLDTVLAAALGDLEAIEAVQALVDAAQASAAAAASSESVVLDSVASAAASQSAAAASASSASGSAASATASASSASTSASTATTQAGLAAISRTNAGTSETNAAASASAASTSAGTASTHATTATTQAGNASTSATNANNSAIAAAASAAAASTSFDSFDDRYLGPKASDPATDNDGNALVVGAIYFNTTTGLKIYSGVTWMSYSAVSGDMLKSDNLSGLANYTTARSNMGLAIGTNVQAYDATLASIAALGTAADKMIYTTGVDTWAELAVTSVGRALLDDTSASAQRTTMGAAGLTQTDWIGGIIKAGANQDYRIIEDIPHGATLTKFVAKCASGTITLTLKINSTAVTTGVINATTSQIAVAPTAANVMVATDELVITASSNSSAVDVSFAVHFTKPLVV